MADSQRLTIARWSHAVSKYYYLPPPRHDLKSFVLELQRIIDAENITQFIPTCEEAIYVAFHKDKFKCKVWTCDRQTIINLHNKNSFYQEFSSYLPIPPTVLIKDFSNWDLSHEYVFKQVYSRFATSTIIGKTIAVTHFENGDYAKWVAQKYIKGTEICVYSIWDYGTLKAYSTYHPLYRAGKGAGIFFEPIVNENVYTLVSSFGKKINYTGQLCFDVIIDKDNTPWFIECNPRGTSGAHLIHRDLALCFLKDKQVVVRSNAEFSIKYAMAIFHPMAFFNKKVWTSKDVIYTKKDKKPFFLQALSLLEIAYIKFTKGKTWLQATTSDIEWNGDED
jgi:hypothetical protein